MPTGKCPNCNERVHHAKMEDLDLKIGVGKTVRGMSISCPKCKTILGVQLHPQLLEQLLMDRLMKGK